MTYKESVSSHIMQDNIVILYIYIKNIYNDSNIIKYKIINTLNIIMYKICKYVKMY